MNISELYSSERGSENFNLFTNNKIHDRLVCFDDNIFSFGGSVKDASKFNLFSLSKLEPSTENFEKINKLITDSERIIFSI